MPLASLCLFTLVEDNKSEFPLCVSSEQNFERIFSEEENKKKKIKINILSKFLKVICQKKKKGFKRQF